MKSIPGIRFGSLRSRLILVVALVHAVLMSLFIWDLTQRQKAMFLEQQTASAKAMSQNVATSAAGWVASRDLAGLQEIAEAQRLYPELEFVMVLDTEGQVLAHSDRSRLGQYLRDLPVEAKLTILNRSSSLVEVASPVMLAGRLVGWVRVGMGQQSATLMLNQITRKGLLYAITAIALGVIIAGLVGTSLTRKIYAIRKVSKAVHSGSREARVLPLGDDEVGQLATDFNEMLDGLGVREDEIQRLNAQLEGRVHDRTRELEEILGLNRRLVGAAMLGILAYDSNGQCVLANEAAAKAVGGTVKDLLAQNFRKVPSWKKSGLLSVAEEVLASGEAQRHEVAFVTSFGRELVLDYSLVRFESRGGPHLLATFSEVTERKRAEEELQAAQRTLVDVNRLQNAILDGAGMGIVSVDTNGLITTFSTGAEKLLGYGREEMIGLKSLDFFHTPMEIQARAAELGASLKEEIEPGFAVFCALPRRSQPDEREWTLVQKDGGTIPVWESITALRDTMGQIRGYLSLSRDLTEQKRIDTALHVSEERLRKVLGQADCLVWEAKVQVTTDDWGWRFTIHPSGLYQQLFGTKNPNQGAGLWYQFKIPEQQEMNRRSREAMESGQSGYVQVFRVIRDEKTMWIRESVSIMRLEPGNFWLVGVATDITEQKRAEALQAQLLAELSRSNTELEQFAYVASHDLKSPLRAIDSLAGWLQEDLESVLNGESRKHIELLRQRTHRMERFLDDLLEYARAGRVPTDIVPVSPSQLITEIIEMINPPEEFAIRMNQSVPAFETAVTPLRQVLTNLISNAIKHHDGKAGLVEVEVRDTVGWYEFTVADDGPGIPPEFHERIFGMFQTLRPRDEVEGSGIGLALVKRIVLRYGGTITVACREPRGSAFSFQWPKKIEIEKQLF